MQDPEELRRQADEAEALAAVVSYGRDKVALTEKAAELRRRADEADQGRKPED